MYPFPKLDMAKAHILGMDVLNENFSACQNYIKTYHLNVKESEKTSRIVSQVQQSTNSSQNQGSYQPKRKACKGHISNKDWNNMMDAQKEAVKAKHLSDKIQKERGVIKTVTISEEPATCRMQALNLGRMPTLRRLKMTRLQI